jgi:hypothetical protein
MSRSDLDKTLICKRIDRIMSRSDLDRFLFPHEVEAFDFVDGEGAVVDAGAVDGTHPEIEKFVFLSICVIFFKYDSGFYRYIPRRSAI